MLIHEKCLEGQKLLGMQTDGHTKEIVQFDHLNVTKLFIFIFWLFSAASLFQCKKIAGSLDEPLVLFGLLAWIISMYKIQIEQDQNTDRSGFFGRFLRFLYTNENQKKLYTRYYFRTSLYSWIFFQFKLDDYPLE